jgi:hypothetical protein
MASACACVQTGAGAGKEAMPPPLFPHLGAEVA